ncbi:XRE family transcriptional regulator [Streptomyces sp. NPDC058049]|uniref:XRE family transcriptional regulator n=1 Tax=Streptomyces sp. NPDC058049 TaxID=3346314 RepID=UPI0036EDB970
MSQRQRNEALAQARDTARERMVARLLAALPLTDGQARELLQRGKAWASQPVRELDAYLAQNPAGLAAPTSHCPLALPRLLRVLRQAGHGALVGELACVRCGRTDRKVEEPTPEGRACTPCTRPQRTCARCGRQRHVAAVWEDGPVCNLCYSRDPRRWRECGRCGQQRSPAGKTQEGFLCHNCWPRPAELCTRCGQVARVRQRTPAGPVCSGCYQVPARQCGGCGTVRPIRRRGNGSRPDLCHKCDPLMGECVVCGRRRRGARLGRGGQFHCASCRPRPVRRCEVCENARPVHVTWPLGPVCDRCYTHRRTHPGPCASCGQRGTLVGRTDTGDEMCGECCGIGPVFTCAGCGNIDAPYAEGRCTRCVLQARVLALLSDEAGLLDPRLQPVADCLTGAAHPRSVIHWLKGSTAARLLTELAATPSSLTHDLLDALPQEPRTRYVRGLLVSVGILPDRDETLAQTELWVARTVAALPAGRRGVVHAFADWHTLKTARRQAARGRYTAGSAAQDRTEILRAIDFLHWLDTQNLTLDRARQADLERWIGQAPGHRRGLVAFIRWTRLRNLADLTLPAPRSGLPQNFLDDAEMHTQLRRCMTETTLPLEVRVTGALVRLYALPVSRIAALTADDFTKDETGAYLTLGSGAVLLPPRLAALVQDLIAQPHRPAAVAPSPAHDPGYLFPGKVPGRPRSSNALRAQLGRHGLLTLAARNSAMITMITDMPPQVVSDLLGFSPVTTTQWATYLQDSWAHYLSARNYTPGR